MHRAPVCLSHTGVSRDIEVSEDECVNCSILTRWVQFDSVGLISPCGTADSKHWTCWYVDLVYSSGVVHENECNWPDR